MANQTNPEQPSKGLHIVAKPAGPKCNLNCEYCFYLEKKGLFSASATGIMSDDVLEAYVSKYIAMQPTPVVPFVWQGGEPTLAGLDFFKRAVELQMRYAGGKVITNAFQTNGILLDDTWCSFLKKHNFLVGLSLDGPREIHDHYRVNHAGRGSFDEVLRALKLLQKHQVEMNVMATVGRETTSYPLEVYQFFKRQGVEFIQFAPVIERHAGSHEQQQGLLLAGMPNVAESCAVTEWSVEPEAYGDFLITVFDDWVRNDVGTTNVMNFEWALNAWIGNDSPVCQFARSCGMSIMLEHNGDLYACDHFMYPEYRLGNILEDDPLELGKRSVQGGFGDKESGLSLVCQECEVLQACWGGCPKHRFSESYRGEPGHYYLCAGNKKFFMYIRKYLRAIAQLLENGLPASMVMQAIDGPLVIDKSKFNH